MSSDTQSVVHSGEPDNTLCLSHLDLVARHTMTGLKVAMKFISKRKISTAEMSNRVHREVGLAFEICGFGRP